MFSVYFGPKVITLSNFHCYRNLKFFLMILSLSNNSWLQIWIDVNAFSQKSVFNFLDFSIMIIIFTSRKWTVISGLRYRNLSVISGLCNRKWPGLKNRKLSFRSGLRNRKWPDQEWISVATFQVLSGWSSTGDVNADFLFHSILFWKV